MVISLFILCFASTLAFSSTNKEKQLEALSDSVSNKIGQKDFIPFYQEYMRLARQQNDTAKIDDAYSQIASHYYRLRNTDSLKVVAYEYMDWCLKRGNINNRYTQWRQYIQLLTEKGLQDEPCVRLDFFRRMRMRPKVLSEWLAARCVSDIIIGCSATTSSSVLNTILPH
ncbi:hypothetical protein NXX83_24225 [Bacteroides thetaiotaomicron]|nr:hypothetical protein NXX83_24225 [Bacteroides thetaiotaomicron]